MPGVDILAQLGAARWIATDGARLQHALQRARFDLMAVASRRALAGDLAAGNAEVKALLDASPQMRGWVVLHPAFPERSAEQMRRYLGGSQWLGAMLHPRLFGESLISGGVRELINSFRRYTRPLLIGVPDEAAVREVEQLAAEFTTLKFIASGAGGDAWQHCLLAARRRPNLFLEPFSGGPHQGKLETMLQTLGPHRILFASNYPDSNPGAALGLLLDARISDAEKQAILTTSAVRLFDLARPAEPPAA